jgi:large subunit ribosomal protein L9
MKIILRRTVPKLGERGQIVEVKDGYARNFLLPRGMAYEAIAENERRIAKERKQADDVVAARVAESQSLASRLEGISATVQVKADGETIYGSVAAEEIVAAISSEHGVQLDPAVVCLDEAIKKIGTHNVKLNLGEGAEAEIKVWVLPEDGELAAEESQAEAAAEAPTEATEATEAEATQATE